MSRLRGGPKGLCITRRAVLALCRVAFLLALAVEALPAQTTVLVERFDSVAPPALPAGWCSSQIRHPPQNDFESSASAPHSPPNALVSTNATLSQELISPEVSFFGRSPGTLSFVLRRSATYDACLLVEASTDGGEEFGLVVGDTIRPSPETVYQTFALPFPALLRSPARFRWRTIAGIDGTSGTLRIDDIVITADAMWDVALAGVQCDPPAARTSSVARARVRIAGVGSEKLPAAEILIGLDGDMSGTLAGSEIWSRAPLPLVPARGETTEVDLEFRAPAPGEYHLLAMVDSPEDQGTGNNTARFIFLSGYPPHALVVNEIMYAPAAPEPEWIELASLDTSAIPLARWRVGDAGSPEGKEIAAPGGVLPGRGLALLCRSASALAEVRPECGAGCIEMGTLPSLNNTGDCIIVRDFAGFVIDSVCYLPGWGGSAGRSLERRDGEGSSNDFSNWGSCTDSGGATPCRRNSLAVLDTDLALVSCVAGLLREGEQGALHVTVRNDGRATVASASVTCVELREGESGSEEELFVARGAMSFPLARGESTPVSLLWDDPPGGVHHLLVRLGLPGDGRAVNDTLTRWVAVGYRDPFLRISEIMAAPRQGEAEYVEVVNAGEKAIDLAGWTVGDARRSSSREYVLSRKRLLLGPGSWFVIASDSTLLQRFTPCDTHLVAIAGTGSLQLNNDADAVVLRDPFGRGVDSVVYEGDWHSPVLSDPVGRSLERISAGLPSRDPGNWGTSVSGSGGTPGCRNSIWHDGVLPAAFLGASPNPFSPDGDGRDDHTIIRFEIPRACGWMSMRIFDVAGRMIRVLANNEPCGHAGAVVWDGLDDGRRRVRIGIYIVLLEVTAQDGGRLFASRGSVVVAGKLR